MPRWATASIRVRLTAWYAGVLALMLVVYAAATYAAVRHEFLEQFDDELHEDLENAEGLLAWNGDGRVEWQGAGDHDADAYLERAYDVWSMNGDALYRSSASRRLPPPVVTTGAGHADYETIEIDDEHWRTLTSASMLDGRAVIVRAARSEEPLRRQIGEILLVLGLGLPIAVVVAGLGGYALARRALAPIDHLASEAQRITADRLHERLHVTNAHDEIGRLAAVINGAVARLEASFDQLRRFTADASHELRTPLAVVRGIGEGTLASRRSSGEYEEAIGSMLEEVDRMTTLVDTLLRLSRGDAGTIHLSREAVDVGQLAREVTASLGVLLDERNQTAQVDAEDGVVVSADRLVLREAITNVLDNAIKYGPPASTIGVRVVRDGARAAVIITDEGPGIPAEHRLRIFDRFFRIDEARSRDRGGTGLGLAIAKWAVDAHGGEIAVSDRPGGGSTFTIHLLLQGV